jgi:hypothetical protein
MHGGSPGGLPGPWRGDKEKQWTMMSPERGDTTDLDPGKQICMLAMEELAPVLHMVDEETYLGQKNNRVR